MSGGFFRGTSADQDTRFSNKQAKLLKTHKFAPELDHLVDMRKVKMDLIRPWIATRVTQLLGFEDEVLINFIYGLLDVKEVDGKQIQIQLTGFMEKNTVKFMKELWGLLLSAQQNVSGVPQQFLDAKEAEMLKKKEEDDRIAQEIQKRREKEGRDAEQVKRKRMDEEAGNARYDGVTPASGSARIPRSEEQKEVDRKRPLRDEEKLRSISISPQARGRSVSRSSLSPSPSRRTRSPDRLRRSPRRSVSPRRQRSPLRRSPYARRRSRSISRRSHSPPLRRFPFMRRKFPYGRRRSPFPSRRRSPAYLSRRSPSPAHRWSPVQRRSLSPARHTSPSPVRRRPPSPVRNPLRSRSPKSQRRSSPRNSIKSHATVHPVSPQGRRSISPDRSPSLPFQSRRRLGGDSNECTNGVNSNQDKDILPRNRERRSPPHHIDNSKTVEPSDMKGNVPDSSSRRLAESLRAPQRDSRHQRAVSNKHDLDHSPRDSGNLEKNTTGSRSRNLSESPAKNTGKQLPSDGSMDTSREEEQASRARVDARRANSSRRKNKDLSTDSPKRRDHVEDSPPGEHCPYGPVDDFAKASNRRLEKLSEQQMRAAKDASASSEDSDHQPRTEAADSPIYVHDKQHSARGAAKDASFMEDRMSDDVVKGSRSSAYEVTAGKKLEHSESDNDSSGVRKAEKKLDESFRMDSDNGFEKSEKYKARSAEKRRHKKSDKHRRHLDGSSESDSEPDDKEAKRIRKEEKRLRKDERRRRREERHRRKLEHRARKVKTVDTVTPPLDIKNESDEDAVGKRGGSASGGRGETESENKRLEFELREKALESIRQKKAISH